MPLPKLTLRDIVKIAVIGPESSGKSTLVQQLATHFNAPFVPEFARTYLEEKQSPGYEFSDLEAIAQGQLLAMQRALSGTSSFVFFDTDLITLHIWVLDKFDKPIPFVEANLQASRADLCLVCKPDIPWVADPLREDSLRRDELFNWNLWVLHSLDARAEIISGSGEIRTEHAIMHVKEVLNTLPS